MEEGRRAGKEHVNPNPPRTASSHHIHSMPTQAPQEDLREELEKKRSHDMATSAESSQGRTQVATPQPISVLMTAEMAKALKAILDAYHASTMGVTQGDATLALPRAPPNPNPSQGGGGQANIDPLPKGSIFGKPSKEVRPKNKHHSTHPTTRHGEGMEEGQDESRTRSPSQSPQHSHTQTSEEVSVQSPNKRAKKGQHKLVETRVTKGATYPQPKELLAQQQGLFTRPLPQVLSPQNPALLTQPGTQSLQPRMLFPPPAQATLAAGHVSTPRAPMPTTQEEIQMAFQAFLKANYGPEPQEIPPSLGATQAAPQVPSLSQYQATLAGTSLPPTTTPIVGGVNDPNMNFLLREIKRLEEKMKKATKDDSGSSNPLSLAIRNAPTLPFIKVPTLTYEGNTSAKEFANVFEDHMLMSTNDSATQCKLFACALRGPAQTWYRSLPEGSIVSWDQLKNLFITNFKTAGHAKMDQTHLIHMKQLHGEALKIYVERFKEAVLKCENVNDDMARAAFMGGLATRELYTSLATTKPNTWDKMLNIAYDYVHAEEMFNLSTQSIHLNDEQGSIKFHKKDSPTSRFTPLATTYEEVFNYIQQTDCVEWPIVPPGELRGKDMEKYCILHQCMGHDIENCFDLKIAIENMLVEGKLLHFKANLDHHGMESAYEED